MTPCNTKWQQKWLGLDIVHPDIQRLADEAEAFCGRWAKNVREKSLLVIVGAYGSGKTHTARQIFKFCFCTAAYVFEKGKWGKDKVPSSLYIPWPEVVAHFMEKNFSIMESAFDSDLLVIDDIGAENDPFKIGADKLCQILSRRENAFTVVTTNIAPENWTERFDGRVNDRLLRNSVIVDISGVGSYAMR